MKKVKKSPKKIKKKKENKMGDGGAGAGGGAFGNTSGPLGTITPANQAEAAKAMGYPSVIEAMIGESGGMANVTPGTGLLAAPSLPAQETSGDIGINPTGEIFRPSEAIEGEATEFGGITENRPGQRESQGTRSRRRRRSLLSEEEGGLLSTAPVRRRSIFGA